MPTRSMFHDVMKLQKATDGTLRVKREKAEEEAGGSDQALWRPPQTCLVTPSAGLARLPARDPEGWRSVMRVSSSVPLLVNAATGAEMKGDVRFRRAR